MQKGDEHVIKQHSAATGNVQHRDFLFELLLPDLSPCVTWRYPAFTICHHLRSSVFVTDPTKKVGRDSAVGIATRYWLDGPRIESRWGRDFLHPSQTGLRAHPASCTIATGAFPGVKRSELGVDHPPPYSAEVEGRVELYVFSHSGSSWHVLE